MKYFIFLTLFITTHIYPGAWVQNFLEKKPHKLTLYAPWREVYGHGANIASHTGCPFCCEIEESQDESNFILHRSEHAIVMLNLYPYSKGHLLIIPYKHIDTLDKLSDKELMNLMQLISFTTVLVQQELHAVGVNVGMNIGKNSGASIPDHIHIHVIPRFNNDRGYINLIGQTEVVSWNLSRLYFRLKPYFNNLIIN